MNKFSSIFLITIFALTACKKGQQVTDEEMPVFSEKIAKVVNHVTVGNIKSTQAIEIGFNDKIVEYEAINKDLGSDLIILEPDIDGALSWSD